MTDLDKAFSEKDLQEMIKRMFLFVSLCAQTSMGKKEIQKKAKKLHNWILDITKGQAGDDRRGLIPKGGG